MCFIHSIHVKFDIILGLDKKRKEKEVNPNLEWTWVEKQ
jgi:hypothetical protein